MHISIDSSSANQRFDKFLRKYFKQYPEVSLWDIFSRIRTWAIKVNNRKTKENYRLQPYDTITWDDSIITDKSIYTVQKSKKQKIHTYPLQKIKDMLVYEDTHWLVFNKPPHIVMHPGSKHATDLSLHDIMKSYLYQTKQNLATETFHPSFCFRLDKNTSGTIIAAKTYKALQYLNQIIRERKVSKTYYTLLLWHVKAPKTINAPLFKWYDKASGKGKMFVNTTKWVEAKTHIVPVHHYTIPHIWAITLAKIQLFTWRMHQIRIHAAYWGYPVLWDLMYGKQVINRLLSKKYKAQRQLLHSSTYWFFDIFTNKQISFTSPLPEDFTLWWHLWEQLSWNKL